MPLTSPAPGESPAVEASEGQRATLRGTVVGAEDEVPIADALVYVRGGGAEAKTGGDGSFTLGLRPGTYQISVIAPGFATQNISKVELRPSIPTKLDIKLNSGSVTLDEMVVVGTRIRGGIATLIAERRDSKAVADVIGAEQMARSGDSNAAAALSRVTGITVVDGRWVLVRGMGQRYSTLTLNAFQVPSPDPTRRVVPLDLFPAGVIDSVIVQKTYTSDLPGEFGGGLVQLRSRDYPHEFLFNVNLATGGNANAIFQERFTASGGKYDFLGIDDGSRKLPGVYKDPRGRLEPENIANQGQGYSEEEINSLGRLLPRKYNTHKETALPDLTMGANVGNEWRLRYAKIGFVAGVAYRNEFRNILNAYVNDNPGVESIYRQDAYRQQTSLSGFLDWGVTFSANHRLKFTTMYLRQTDDTTQRREYENDAKVRQTYIQWVERQILLQQVAGKHAFFDENKLQVDWRYAFGRAGRYEPNRRFFGYGLNQDGEYAYQTGSGVTQHVFGDLRDVTHEAALDLAQSFPLWRRLQGKARAGAFFYRRDRAADARSFELTVMGDDIDRVGAPNGVITSDRIGDGISFREVTRATDTYDAQQQIEAGYAALDLPVVKPFEVSGGARLEHARFDVKTFDPFDDKAPPVRVKLDNLDVLPFASLTWRFYEDFQLRGGYSRTLNRPDLRELSPGRYYDLEQNLLLVGNPTVKRALIENFDARIEWYYKPDEVFSIGGFLKRFQDPIEDVLQAGQETVRTVQNVDKAISYGLELEGRKRLDFIAKVLRPLYLAANFSLIDSKVRIPLKRGFHERPLQGQSPWVVNVQLGWDDSEGSGLAASLLYNSAGKRIRFVGDEDQMTGDTYELPIHRLDFVISQKLPHKLNLGARVRNLLNAKETWKEYDVITRRFRRGTDFQVSLSWAY